ncbi:ABC transporter ATP-binding protein [Candidatus Contubernalis alkaliaceticus]|uniref:ABC transporter ATP-binding protein n=1 Tax=Candidatus Contubernalis alkaliaceticus TaxID=338645 RepID=UPI001F4C34E3|nr:ABC transporter ATP-binding protein [Candidatus Contubernalis alkalaceticus]UNC91401.1 ABC transporter ATP-binding protein [Candidatus Contubernalis alkalaceticus]
MKNDVVLRIENLHKSYGEKKIIDGVELSVRKGDIYGFLGPNGSGKTTTIRMILGLISLDQGSITLNGYDINKDFKKAIRKVGAVVETPKFFQNYSGYKNLKLMAGLYSDLPPGKVDEVLEMVGLKNRSRDKVSRYSLGMKQRLGIAMALLNQPEVVILDEPTNGLDPQGMKEIREMIVQLSLEQDITFFISSHLLHEVEQICNKVGILKEGRKLAEGTVQELLKKDYEAVEVLTSSREKAVKVLENTGFARDFSSTERGIRMKVDKGYSEELIRRLVHGGVPVQYVIPENQSLEKYFIKLTQGGEQIA